MYSNDITQQAQVLTNFILAIYSNYTSRGFTPSAAKKEVIRILAKNISDLSNEDGDYSITLLYYLFKELQGIAYSRKSRLEQLPNTNDARNAINIYQNFIDILQYFISLSEKQ